MPITRWNEVAREQMNPGFARQVLHSDSMTVAKVYLAAGSIVPRHQHPNEQITMLEQGRLRFVFDDHEEELLPGQAMQIPSGVPHLVEALEESVATDLFTPVREDWRSGSDAYLRSR